MLRNKPKLILLIALILIGLVAILFFVTQHNRPPKDAKENKASDTKDKPALSVTLIQPQTRQIPITLAANGNIAAWQESSIGSEANGLRLTAVNVNVGDVVHAGDVLATYAPDTLQANVAQAHGALVQTQATAAQDFANAALARKLDMEGALSKQDISLYLSNANAAKAKIDAAEATLNAQKIQLKFAKVYAPDDGIISSRTATVGAVVLNGTELFRLIRKGRLEWRAEVTSDEVYKIKIGDNASIQSVDGSTVSGRVRMIAPTVDPQTRIALIYVDLPAMQSASSAIKAGMYARGSLNLGQSVAATLPQTAVVMRDGFNYVFAVTADHHVQQIKVQTGRLLADQIEITSPLPAGIQLVASGGGFLNDGDTVRVVQPPSIAAR